LGVKKGWTGQGRQFGNDGYWKRNTATDNFSRSDIKEHVIIQKIPRHTCEGKQKPSNGQWQNAT
jgi:hypothetical protein